MKKNPSRKKQQNEMLPAKHKIKTIFFFGILVKVDWEKVISFQERTCHKRSISQGFIILLVLWKVINFPVQYYLSYFSSVLVSIVVTYSAEVLMNILCDNNLIKYELLTNYKQRVLWPEHMLLLKPRFYFIKVKYYNIWLK